MKRKANPQHQRHAAKPVAPVPAQGPRLRRPAAVVVGALTLAGVVVLALWLAPVPESARNDATAQSAASADGSAWQVGMLRPDGLRIVVTGRDDASKVLDAEQFARPEVRNGYRIAKRIPAVLNRLYCWCGCENRGVHRSNLQCFEDRMAEDCPVCLGTAEIAYDMTRRGITDAAQIQAAVDVHWGGKR